jgi:lambda family phage portal protein
MASMNPLVGKGKAILAAAKMRLMGGADVAAPAQVRQEPVLTTSALFMGNNQSPIMNNWRPSMRETQDDVRQSWTLANARAIDTIQNSGWIAGGLQSAVGKAMGAGLRLVAKPDTTIVKFEGLKAEDGSDIDAEGWARFVERRWEQWANNPLECDALARQTVAQLTKAAYKTWYATGEIVATLPFYKDKLSRTGTKVLLLPPSKLSQTTNPTRRVVQGVQMDERGRPYAYLFRRRDGYGVERDVPVLARDGANRPQVIHVYEGLPGQVRGITPLVPALKVVRQYDQLADATLTAALIQTIFAATVESDAPTMDILNALITEDQQGVGGRLEDFLAARMGWHSSTTIDLSGQGKIAHLFPGEKLEFKRSEHPNTNYENMVKILLREIAKCMGITVEQLTGDYTGVTYTGVRMGESDNWQTTLDRRQNVLVPFVQPVYEAWLEEEIESGVIRFPGGIAGFLENRAGAVRAEWRGPPKPQADDLKSAKAHETYRAMGVVSDSMIADDLGVRIEDVYEARKREAAMREKFQLPDVGPSTQLEIARTSADTARMLEEEAAQEAEDNAQPENA